MISRDDEALEESKADHYIEIDHLNKNVFNFGENNEDMYESDDESIEGSNFNNIDAA